MKKKLFEPHEIYNAWVSIGTDDHPIGVSWYRANLQDNAKRIPCKVIPGRIWRRILRELEKGVRG